ncbi:MAG: hypothetical protein A2W00_10170 [Candidatus Eisenbacteria bacterium RBG_16_71_46]|nr:MAG: hypothetical protein A2W00_10170 [Candidatus Eisenbacteria bacterium RBG_16_71_46]
MNTQSVFRRTASTFAAAALALALLAGPARPAGAALASPGREAAPTDVEKTLRYVGCALAIAGATGGWGIAIAVVGCLVLIADDL